MDSQMHKSMNCMIFHNIQMTDSSCNQQIPQTTHRLRNLGQSLECGITKHRIYRLTVCNLVIGRFLTLQIYRLHIYRLCDWQILHSIGLKGFAFCILTDSSIYALCNWQISQSTDSQIVQSIDCVFGGFHTLRIDNSPNLRIHRFCKLWILCLADSHSRDWQILNLWIHRFCNVWILPRWVHTQRLTNSSFWRFTDFELMDSVLCRFHKLEINKFLNFEDSQILQSMDSVLGGFHTSMDWSIDRLQLTDSSIYRLHWQISHSTDWQFLSLQVTDSAIYGLCAWQILYFTDWIQNDCQSAISMIQLICFEPKQEIFIINVLFHVWVQNIYHVCPQTWNMLTAETL